MRESRRREWVGLLEERVAYVAVEAELEVLRELQPFDAADVAEVEEPEVGEDFAFEDVAGDDAAEDVDVDF